jgi:outer membrane lipoprotein-sorting protein
MRTIPLLAALLALAALPIPARAETQPAAATADPQQAADLARVEAYLNGLTTAQASFTMVAPDAQQSKGQFYLSRPAKLRFEYTEPKGNLLIADGDYVIYWDAQQKEASNLPISQTPLAFLLKPHVSLSDSAVRITRFEHAAGVIRVGLVQAKDATAGSVTVAFSDQPLELRGWRLVDAQGQVTDVTFSDWKLGPSLDPALFHFQAPDSGKRHR